MSNCTVHCYPFEAKFQNETGSRIIRAPYDKESCPYCQIAELTKQLEDARGVINEVMESTEWDRHVADLNEDNRSLREQLATVTAEKEAVERIKAI